MQINLRSGPVAFACGAVLLYSFAAIAEPIPSQIADSLVAATTATGRVQASYENATANGDDIIVSGYKITRKGANAIEIPTILISGAVEREGGGFTAKTIAFDNGKASRGNDTGTWSTGLIEDALIPSADEIKAEADILPFGKFTINELALAESNLKTPATAAQISIVMQPAADGSPGAFAAQISGIHFAAEVLKGRTHEKAVLDALGYEQFDLNIAVAGAFDAASQSMTLNTLTINAAEIGNVTIKASLSGVSLGKIIATRTDAETRSEAKLDNLEVRFDNVGVVERALDMHAALIWGTREDAAAQVNAALPLVLHFIGNSTFQEKVTTAMREFLVNPKSLAFSAAPISPVSLDQIIETTRNELDDLPDLLQANITAN